MKSLLTSDAKLVVLTMRLGDLVLLNLCFLLCCLPIVTIAPACSALYSVCFRMGTSQEYKAIPGFFKSFRQNCKQGIGLSLILGGLLLGSGYAFLLFLSAGPSLRYALIPSLMVVLVVLIVASYAVALTSLFKNTIGRTLKNALILGLSYLPRSLCIAAINAAPLALLLAAPSLFLRLSIFLIFLYFSGAAFLNSRILGKVFSQFLPQNPSE